MTLLTHDRHCDEIARRTDRLREVVTSDADLSATATVVLRGPLTSVLLAFYRRLPPDSPGLEVLGERAVLEFWLENTAFG